jgi:UDP-N-acetyl-D-mannosaminuronate dehydrogenase
MSAATDTDSPAGVPSSHAATRSHCFIETSGEINEFMKMHVVNLAEKGLRQVGKRLYGAKITVMGLAYKKNINDPRESPAIKIIEELANLGADVRVYDPFVPSIRTKAGVFTSAGNIEEALSGAECAVFLVDHDVFRGISVETVKGLMASPVVVCLESRKFEGRSYALNPLLWLLLYIFRTNLKRSYDVYFGNSCKK